MSRVLLVLVLILGAAATGWAADIPRSGWTFYQKYKGKPHYRALACTRQHGRAWACGGAWGHSTVRGAIDRAMSECEKSTMSHEVFLACRLKAIGNINVGDMNKEQLDQAIERYRFDLNATK